jgi:hypothetical protein
VGRTQLEAASRLIKGFLAKHSILQVCQTPCSPDMAPRDFWMLPRLKTPLKGSHFDSREDIVQNVMAQLHIIPKQAFHQWKDSWAKCMES